MKLILFVCLFIASSFAVKSTTQVSMQNSGPADVLLDHLKSVQTSIKSEQAEHDKLYNEQHQECEDEFAARTTAITDGEDALARASAHHARCEASHLEAEADLAQVRAYQSEIEGTLAKLKLKREDQAADYKTLIEDELEPAIKAVIGAYPIIDSFQTGSSSFLEVTVHMSKTFKTLVKAGKGANMAAPLAALAQLGADFNAESIAQVRTLFEKLEADLVDARNDANDLEKKRIAAYADTTDDYSKIQANLAGTEEQLTQYSADMQACIVAEAQIIEQASKKVRNNKEALKYAIDMCRAFEEEYENASKGRAAELKLLEKLTEFIREQAEIFGDYGNEDSNVFETYKNSYEKELENQVNSFISLRLEKNKEHLKRMNSALKSF